MLKLVAAENRRLKLIAPQLMENVNYCMIVIIRMLSSPDSLTHHQSNGDREAKQSVMLQLFFSVMLQLDSQPYLHADF